MEVSRTPVEDGSEDAWAVRTWQTHPLDPTARRDEAVDLTVGEERVLGDRRERALDRGFENPRRSFGSGAAVSVCARLDGLAKLGDAPLF